jgi:hypothetical protein
MKNSEMLRSGFRKYTDAPVLLGFPASEKSALAAVAKTAPRQLSFSNAMLDTKSNFSNHPPLPTALVSRGIGRQPTTALL